MPRTYYRDYSGRFMGKSAYYRRRYGVPALAAAAAGAAGYLLGRRRRVSPAVRAARRRRAMPSRRFTQLKRNSAVARIRDVKRICDARAHQRKHIYQVHSHTGVAYTASNTGEAIFAIPGGSGEGTRDTDVIKPLCVVNKGIVTWNGDSAGHSKQKLIAYCIYTPDPATTVDISSIFVTNTTGGYPFYTGKPICVEGSLEPTFKWKIVSKRVFSFTPQVLVNQPGTGYTSHKSHVMPFTWHFSLRKCPMLKFDRDADTLLSGIYRIYWIWVNIDGAAAAPSINWTSKQIWRDVSKN